MNNKEAYIIKKTVDPIKASIFLLMLFIFFFGYLTFVVKYVLLIGTLLLLCFISISKSSHTISFSIVDFLFFSYLIICTISIFYTDSISNAIIYIVIWIFGIILKILLPTLNCDIQYINKLIYVFSFVHVLATLMQLFFPNFILSINTIILNSEALYLNKAFLRTHAYAGITGQTGTNAFYVSVFIGVIFCKLISLPKKSKRVKIILLSALIIAFIALIATQKRGPLLFCIVSIMGVLYIWYAKTKRKVVNFIWIVILLCIAIVGIIFFTDYGQFLINKFYTGNYGDISSGRFQMFSLMWEGFKEKPILGHGLASTNILMESVGENLGHNVYLQNLNDLGIIGTLFLLCFMCASLIKTIHMLRVCNYLKDNHIYTYSLLISLYLQFYILLFGLTGNPLYDHFQFLLYIIACTFPGIIKKYLNKNNFVY